jgi:hypothetical protein
MAVCVVKTSDGAHLFEVDIRQYAKPKKTGHSPTLNVVGTVEISANYDPIDIQTNRAYDLVATPVCAVDAREPYYRSK